MCRLVYFPFILDATQLLYKNILINTNLLPNGNATNNCIEYNVKDKQDKQH